MCIRNKIDIATTRVRSLLRGKMHQCDLDHGDERGARMLTFVANASQMLALDAAHSARASSDTSGASPRSFDQFEQGLEGEREQR